MSRGRWGLLLVAALAVGIGIRAAFLWWSPLPATLDGFRYARLANHIVETGDLLVSGVESDELVTTLVLGIRSEITGVRSLYLAQPLVACLGGPQCSLDSCWSVASVAHRIGPDDERSTRACSRPLDSQ